MAKIEVEYTKDPKGIDCIRISKKRGRLSYTEVYEALARKSLEGCVFVQVMQIREELPEDLYDEGDVWFMYEPWDIVPELVTYQGGIDVFPKECVERWKKKLLEE